MYVFEVCKQLKEGKLLIVGFFLNVELKYIIDI